jgi:EmrB/QacA subfamily drug resistance transporter
MSETYTSRGKPTHKGLALLVLGISQLMIILDGTIVNVALNHIAIEFRAFQADGITVDFAQIQWIVTAYALTFGGMLLLGGKLADRFGRKRIFMGGLFLFAFASLLGGFANNLGLLIAARALQGVGGAMLAPSALSLLTTVFDEGKERNRAFGVWAGISAGGAAIGLILGGVLTQYVDWRWVFFVNVPIALFAIWGTLRYVPESKDENARGFDVLGAVLITVGLAGLVYGLANVNDTDVASGTKIAIIGGSVVLIAAFFVWQAINRDPLLPLRLFKFRNITGANIGGLFVGAGLFSSFLYLVSGCSRSMAGRR